VRRIALALLAVLVIALLAVVSFAWAIDGDRRLPVAATSVDIAPGASVDAIVGQLRDEGVISSSHLFLLYLRVKGLTGHLEAAEYDFPAHSTLREVATILSTGAHPAAVWVTIPEGFTAAQIAYRLADHGLVNSSNFLSVVRNTDLVIDGWKTRGLEGYLFPDTYLVPRHASSATIASLMTEQFVRELPPKHVQLAHRLGFSLPQIVTVASMVEREAKVDAERPIIAGVIYNRLRRNMPLQIDATVEYALPHHKTALSFKDLRVNSPYNTYRYRGLPRTPIANPGGKSLLAAFHPARVDYLYYVYRGNGRHKFSRTLEEQRAAERKYLN
jgi:UPF0755 protein